IDGRFGILPRAAYVLPHLPRLERNECRFRARHREGGQRKLWLVLPPVALPAGVPPARPHLAIRPQSAASGRGYHATPETGVGSVPAPRADARVPGSGREGAAARRRR